MFRIHIFGHWTGPADGLRTCTDTTSYTVSSPNDVASPMIREAVLTCAELGEPVKMGNLFVEPLSENV